MPALWINFPVLIMLSCATTMICYYLFTVRCHHPVNWLVHSGQACRRCALHALSFVANWCEGLVESVEGWAVVAPSTSHSRQRANGHVDERPLVVPALDRQLWKHGLNSRTMVLYFARGHWSSERDSYIPLNVLARIEAFLIEAVDGRERPMVSRTALCWACCRCGAVDVANACGRVFRCVRRQRTPVIPFVRVDAPQSRGAAGAVIYHKSCNTPLADAWTSVASDLCSLADSRVRSRGRHKTGAQQIGARGQQFVCIVP